MADPLTRIAKAAERVRKADATGDAARAELRQMMREELDAGTVTKSGIARALGVSRQRVQKMIGD